MKKLDLTVIILTYNEEVHIRRCLENVCPIAKKVYVIDSPSTDRTAEICGEFENVEVVVHKYPGNQAEQVNWALKNLSFDTKWILRLDADEYLSQELIDEICEKLPSLPDDVSGVVLNRYHIFLEKLMKYGSPAKILRLFRTGKAVCEKRLMDEYMAVKEGRTIDFKNLFYDYNLKGIDDYCKKHLNYAVRQAFLELDEKYGLTEKEDTTTDIGSQMKGKRKQKALYSRMPLYLRSFLYFLYRYFFTGAFLGGKEAFTYTYIQAWWYRTMVDSILLDVRKCCGGDKEKIMECLKSKYGLRV